MIKICPIMSRPVPVGTEMDSSETSEFHQVNCRFGRCELWTSGAYTTEGLPVDGMCAFKLNAIKNADGKVPV